jgi:hypothetical protein
MVVRSSLAPAAHGGVAARQLKRTEEVPRRVG